MSTSTNHNCFILISHIMVYVYVCLCVLAIMTQKIVINISLILIPTYKKTFYYIINDQRDIVVYSRFVANI